jgi:hypothetical protein
MASLPTGQWKSRHSTIGLRAAGLRCSYNTLLSKSSKWVSLIVIVAATYIIPPKCANAFASLSRSHQRRANNKAPDVFHVPLPRLIVSQSFPKRFASLSLYSSSRFHTNSSSTLTDLFSSHNDDTSSQERISAINDSKHHNNAVSTIEEDDSTISFLHPITSKTSEILEAVAAPAQGVLDNVTSGWALSYADLSPDNTNTITGQAFLASNLAYVIAGALLYLNGDIWLGFCTELVAIASFNYHYQQLMSAGTTSSKTVRLALLVDYIFAMISILTGLAYILTSPATAGLPIYTVSIGVAACICLGLSWLWEYGKPYMFWHSLWHFFSAYAGYVISTEHFRATLPPP